MREPSAQCSLRELRGKGTGEFPEELQFSADLSIVELTLQCGDWPLRDETQDLIRNTRSIARVNQPPKSPKPRGLAAFRAKLNPLSTTPLQASGR